MKADLIPDEVIRERLDAIYAIDDSSIDPELEAAQFEILDDAW